MSLTEVSPRPVIGVLTYDIDFAIRDAYNFGEKYPFYISAAFIKWLESAGAEVIPIWADRAEEYYRDIMSRINGVLFPGGKFWFNDQDFGKAAYSARKIYEIATELNYNGKYFPIFGTTLGFQLLFYSASGGQSDSRIKMDLYKGNFPLNFENDYANSQMFGEAEPNIIELLRTQPVAPYYSIYGVTKDILDKYNLTKDWKILSTAIDNNGGEKFITSAEHKNYPFFGVLCHPQKTQFENSAVANNTRDAIRISQYFANFFVEKSRQNTNSMSSDERLRHSIYNFDVTYIEPKVPQFRQVYLFKKDSNYIQAPTQEPNLID